jgi:hypothetical protein
MSAWSRREFVGGSAIAGATRLSLGEELRQGSLERSDREHWITTLSRIADPVLAALSEGKLKSSMPVEAPHRNADERSEFTYLEALGRLMAGMSPWLESTDSGTDESKVRERYNDLARRAIANAVDPSSPDHMNFSKGSQPLVDAAFLALAILRAPRELWQKLDAKTKSSLVEAMRSSRVILPAFNNWLLFSATIEAFFCYVGEEWDKVRVDYAIRQHDEWYKGDGIYGEGPELHWDYYNSFVIQPMLLTVVETVSHESRAWEPFLPTFVSRARRYAAILERLIAPDGSYPAIGRSITYRFGAFHLLADIALRRELPEGIAPAQVRAALTAVMRRTMEAPGTFDEHGWLSVGLCGHQPSLGEAYISTGSLYLCSVGFLPLGLPSADPFWRDPPQFWTSHRIWNGQTAPADHAV